MIWGGYFATFSKIKLIMSSKKSLKIHKVKMDAHRTERCDVETSTGKYSYIRLVCYFFQINSNFTHARQLGTHMLL